MQTTWWLLIVSSTAALFAVVSAQEQPVITTDEKGGIRFQSGGDLVFQTGEGGQFQFMTANGSTMTTGLGEKGDMGEPGPQGMKGDPGAMGMKGDMGPGGAVGGTGEKGERGEAGPSGVMGEKGERGEAGGGGVITWNQCSWANLNLGLNYGLLADCSINKLRNDTWLRVTWNGNMRLSYCTFCCMRWYFTINGVECTDPGPVDSIIYLQQDNEILRQSHVTGICRAAGGRNITAGVVHAHFNIMDCPLFRNAIYDAFTGWNSVSRIILEEVIPRDNTFPELLSPEPPPDFIFSPHYCQYFFPHLAGRQERNVGTIVQVRFKKEHLFTALKLTWEGNLNQRGCSVCCAQWWFSVDGGRCTSFEDITTSIFSEAAVDMFAPTTLTGVCSEVLNVPIFLGPHNIKLEVGPCPGHFISDTASGYFSTSRVIIEEVPLATNPNVRGDLYHPNWVHCAIPANIPEGTRDSGPLNTLTCGSGFSKTRANSSLLVTFNGNIRLTDCSDCCMRWFITINGEECSYPAPIDAVIYTVNGSDVNVHRGSTITGVCEETGGQRIGAGEVEVTMNLGLCAGFNETFDSYTSLQSLSTIEIKELPPPVTSAADKSSEGFTPNWVQCVTSNLSSSSSINSSIMSCSFTKRDSDTVLKVSWDGNVAVEGCRDCCMRWYITVNDTECANPGPIDVAIRANIDSNIPQFDLRRPVTVAGICRRVTSSEGEEEPAVFPPGSYTFDLLATPCPDLPLESRVLTGYNSISRFIIEELPDQIDDECTITPLP